MRVLLDECVPRRLGRELTGHEVHTVPEMGWASRSDGAVLLLADGAFDAIITLDRRLVYQQNVRALPFALVVIAARSNRLHHVLAVAPALRTVLAEVRSGEVRIVSA